jgi:predicted ribonuclease YlaK
MQSRNPDLTMPLFLALLHEEDIVSLAGVPGGGKGLQLRILALEQVDEKSLPRKI